MRRWYLLPIGLALFGALIFLIGCEGEEGIKGEPGEKGPTGPTGYDPFSQAPTSCMVSIGITNGTFNAVAGAKNLAVVFDSTVDEPGTDTIVANHVSRPPLIDGVDGQEAEWGELSSKIPLDFYNPEQDPELEDPLILEALCRAAYDERYVYLLLSWKEVKITVKDPQGREVVLVDMSLSNEMNELKIDIPHPILECVEVEPDSLECDTVFSYLRQLRVVVDVDTICFGTYCIYDTIWGLDTNYVWLPTGKAEDRCAVIWSENEDTTWARHAFDLLFRTDGFTPTLPADIFMDVWLWGAATSGPAEVADDWWITAGGLRADAGSPPYINNFLEPDSVPRYQNLRDPNIRSGADLSAEIYPLWFFDAIAFNQRGWATNRPAFVPGIVQTVPSNSRADVYSGATYDNGLWTLELRRPRNTNSGDDFIF